MPNDAFAQLRIGAQDNVVLAAAGGDVRGSPKSVAQRRGEIFARQRSVLVLTCLRGAAVRLTGKHWDSGLPAGQRRAAAARDLADEEEEWAALAAPGVGGAVVQAYPVQGYLAHKKPPPPLGPP